MQMVHNTSKFTKLISPKQHKIHDSIIGEIYCKGRYKLAYKMNINKF